MDRDFEEQSCTKRDLFEDERWLAMGKLRFSHILTGISGILFAIFAYGMIIGKMSWGNMMTAFIGSIGCIILANISAQYEGMNKNG